MTEIKQVIILGAGGHAKVLANVLKLLGCKVWGCTSNESSDFGKNLLGAAVRGGDDLIEKESAAGTLLVNGLGMTSLESKAREDIFTLWKKRGYSFMTVVHPSAVIADDVILGEGAQVMAGAVIQPGTSIGVNSILNTSSSVDHDCSIGAHVHIAPGAVLSGGVKIGDGTLIGTGAAVIHNIQIGSSVLIGAGSVVTADIGDRVSARGVPAKIY